jgi:biopolymer transport protein ExbB
MRTYLTSAKLKLLRPLAVFWLTLVACAGTAQAAGWWNGEWTIRKRIVLDTGSTGAGVNDPPGPVPVLVRLFDGNFQFAGAQADGSDLRFVAEDGKTPLAFHIEKFDPLLNEAFVWVKVPEVKPAAQTVIWLYYGNASGKAGKAENAKGTYDENTILVYHFAEHAQPAFDSSGTGNNAQNPGVPADGAMIGTGLRVDGKATITIPASPSLFWMEGSALTWSAWVKFGPPQPRAVFFSRRNGDKRFLIGANNGVPFVEVSYQGGTVSSEAGAPVAANTWSHLTVVAAGEKITLYLDGQPYAELAAPLPALDGPAVLGGDGVGGLMNASGAGFTGEIDELQISKVARPAAAIKLAAFGQGRDGAGKFITLGEDEKETSWLSAFKTGYVGVIVGSLTIDGWVVICILAIMSLISWVVMVRKATYLNGIGKGNVQFLDEWSHVASDLSALEDTENNDAKQMSGRLGAAEHRAMMNTPLYRIYHIGINEIQHRLASDTRAADKVLSARSMQAIRATLDGGLVRETQRLNAQMVLLTIAISGGPFLGLLGTVVGVMITFAAVAAAGEVNVNAIAPGIAAALLATVAGLGVAIPALFGYNYLLTRIKVVTSDMHVFIDEFVSKLAEFYSEPSE